MSDFQPNLWDDDVMEMVPDDCDKFFIMSKTIFKGFEKALGDNPQPLLENMASGFENYRRLYQSAMNEYGDAMKTNIYMNANRMEARMLTGKHFIHVVINHL